MKLNTKIIKRSCLALMAITALGTTTAQAALSGRYVWGLHYATMTKNQVISETDTTNPAYKSYAIASNNDKKHGRKTGPWAYVNHASIAKTSRTWRDNYAGYNYKHSDRSADNGTVDHSSDGITVMQRLN